MDPSGVPGNARGDALSAIYDAAVDDAAWRRLPGLLRQAVEGEGAVVWVLGADRRLEGVTDGVPEEALQRFAERYRDLEPGLPAAVRRGLLNVATIYSDVVPDRQLLRTEFYADFLHRYRTEQGVVAAIPLPDGAMLAAAVWRPFGVSRFEARHQSALQAHLPHVRQAVRLRRRINGGAPAGRGQDALEALALGVVICDRRGRVLFANAAAEALAASGGALQLQRRERPLGAARRSDAAALQALIADAATGGPGGAVRLEGAAGERVFALVTPLPPRVGAGEPQALVLLRAADDPPACDAAGLRQLFGLTRAEAEVALALLGDRSLAEIGEARGVSEATLRTQLAQVLRKTETTSQRQLVRLLGQLPPVRPVRG
jgi:DNA-binding CsgD family transcriptional regulator/PAS domain-containing protein